MILGKLGPEQKIQPTLNAWSEYCAGNGRVQYDTTHSANIEEQTGINIKQAIEMLKTMLL